MRYNRIAPGFAFGKHMALWSEDRLALSCFPSIKANGPCAALTGVTGSDPSNPTRVQPSADVDHLVLEGTHLCQVTWDAYQHSRYLLLSIVRPFLPHTTWTEAVEVVQHGRRALPTKTGEASILWLDIANFTEFLDNHPLDKVLPALNAYLDMQTQLVYYHHGDVNKYLGDGFLSVFVTADAAVKAACEIQQAAADLDRRQLDRDELVSASRIGIDTGQIAFVSLGSDNRQDRTVLGMPVNLAKRLQEKVPPGQIWLSQATFDRLRDQSGCRCVGPVEVKGLQEPVVVYEKRRRE